MMRRLAAVVLTGACCWAGSAAAAPPAAGAAPIKEVDGVVVVAGPGPAVKSTYPAAGGRVPAGALVLKIVFDQAMAPDAWAFAPSAEGDFPKCLEHPRLLNDQRTFVLLCSLAPNRSYALAINSTPRFASEYGRIATSFTLKFASTDADTPGVHDALVQAGLTDSDQPILTWKDPGRGVSQTATPP